jgi:2-oxoglutarate ferredoxin oxidoreductase subunit delta
MRIELDQTYCKGCGICIAECPKEVFARGRKRNVQGFLMPVAADADRCARCGRCERLCPEGAIEIEKED